MCAHKAFFIISDGKQVLPSLETSLKPEVQSLQLEYWHLHKIYIPLSS